LLATTHSKGMTNKEQVVKKESKLCDEE